MIETLLCTLSIFLVAAAAAGSQNGGGGGGSGVVQSELWCVARNDAEDAALQSALGWACGPGGADCGPIQTGGPCYDLADLQLTASYAFNDYYLKHGMTDDACYFDHNADLTAINPSHGRCRFPSSKGAKSGNVIGTTTASTTGTTAAGMGPYSMDASGCLPVFLVQSCLLVAVIGQFLFMVAVTM